MQRNQRTDGGMGRLTAGLKALGLVVTLGLGAGGCSTTLSEAQLAYDNEEYEEAQALYEQAIKEGKEDEQEIAKDELFELHMEQAKALKGKGKRQEVHYRAALTLRPADVEAREGLAKALVALYRHDEALQIVKDGVAAGGCKPCERLYVVMLVQRADNQAAAENWAGAEADYVTAATYFSGPGVQLALTRAQVKQGKTSEAADKLKTIAPMIGVEAMDLRAQFLELRREVVLSCLGEDKVKLADDLLDVAPEGVAGAEQLGLAIEVAMEFSRLGKPAEALSRMQALVAAADAGRLRLTDTRKAELRDRVAGLLAARAALSLANGDLPGARGDIDEALKLRPENTRARLQNVLLLAGEGKLNAGKAQLAKVDEKVVGRSQVDAILVALEASRLFKTGDTKGAAASLAAAKKIDADVPEVHVVSAQLLASTPVKLTKADTKRLQGGYVKYPAAPTSVGEALSELAWARKQINGQGDVYMFRGPNTIKQMTELEVGLKAYYPFVVEFQKDPVATLVISAKGGGALQVKVDGSGVATTVDAPAGGSSEVRVDQPGVVTLTSGGSSKSFLAEPYTRVQVAL